MQKKLLSNLWIFTCQKDEGKDFCTQLYAMKLVGFFQVMFIYVNQSTVLFHTDYNDRETHG